MEDKKSEKKAMSVFDKEISKLPKDIKEKLLSQVKYLEPIVEYINNAVPEKMAGFYINALIENVNNKPVPNFEKLTLNFLLDDFDNPIYEFSPKVLLGDKFDEFLIEDKVKLDDGTEKIEYKLKKNTNIKFTGTSISHIRENCFDAIYDDLQKLGSSFIYEDSRGFISALKSIDIHRNMLLQKFEKYIVVYAGAGSWLRGEKSNDFDIFIVVDDTDVKKMPRMQVKDQLTRIVWQMAAEVAQLTGIQLHAQVYLLTDFWDALKDAHPVMFTFLRDGVPFYDRGIYSAWKELLKLGKIKPSSEAIDMHMNIGTQLIDKAKRTFADIVVNDIYNAVLSPAQAILMLKGFHPPTPKESVKIFKDVLYEKEKIVNKKDVETFEKTVDLFKKLEHDRSYQVTGKEIDTLIKDAEEFLEKVKKMFEEISQSKTEESIMSTYSEIINQIRFLPGFSNIKQEEVFDVFNNKFIKTGIMQPFVKKYIDELIKAKEEYQTGKSKVKNVHQILKQARNVLSEIKDYRSKLVADDLGRKKFVIEYNKSDSKKFAQVINYDNNLYLIDLENNVCYDVNTAKQKNIENIDITDNSKLGSIKLDSDLIDKIKKVLSVDEINF